MTLKKDDKIEVTLDGEVNINVDPFEFETEDDGSMSEPSFNSDSTSSDEGLEILYDVPSDEDVDYESDYDSDTKEYYEANGDKSSKNSLGEEDVHDEISDGEEVLDDSEESDGQSSEEDNDELTEEESEIDDEEEPSDKSKEDESTSEESDKSKSSEEDSSGDEKESNEEIDDSTGETDSSDEVNDDSTGETDSSEEIGDKSGEESDSEPATDSDTSTADTGDTGTEEPTGGDTPASDTAGTDQSNTQKTPQNSTPQGNNQSPEGSDSQNTGKKPNKNAGKPDAGDAKDAAKDAAKEGAKDAAKEGVKDAAKEGAKEAVKDGAKEAAKEGAKEAAKEGAKNAAKEGAKSSPVMDKAELAKNAGHDAKDILSKGPKEAFSAGKQRSAIDAMAQFTPWGKIAKGVVTALDAILGKEKTDKLLDKLGMGVYKTTIAGVFVGTLTALFPLIMTVVMVYMVFAPLLDALQNMKEVAINLGNTMERFNNLYTNGNFADSKTAFYQELDSLQTVYGEELDITLLLSTIFYTEARTGYQTKYNNSEDLMVSDANENGIVDTDGEVDWVTSVFSYGKELIDTVQKEANETYDETTGLKYTVGKVYRLRSLAAHMFSSTMLGSRKDYSSYTITLTEFFDSDEPYMGRYKNQVMESAERLIKDNIKDIGRAGIGLVLGPALQTINTALNWEDYGEDEYLKYLADLFGITWPVNWAKERVDDIVELANDVKILLNSLYLGYLSVTSVKVSKGIDVTKKNWTDYVEITMYRYKYNEENYKEYLRKKYIPILEEFEEYLSYDADGNPTETSVERIINEIYEYKNYFEQLFLEPEEDNSEGYSRLCLGAIDKKLSGALSMPVDIDSSKCIEFLDKNSYGYTSTGVLHNGIEVNELSTGNKQGDNVYSVMSDGVVKASSADGSMECIGGCLEIGYEYQMQNVADGSYIFSIVYKGLSKDSVKLKTGDKVDDRQVVGTIGTAAESENIGIPSLYLEFRKQDGTAIDPTNMIVKCTAAGTIDYPGATIINIPQNFTQTSYYTVTCYSHEGYDYNCDVNDKRTWAWNQAKVHNIWVEQGERFKDGIAIITVDGTDRYLVAVKETLASAGDVFNMTLADGTVVPLLIADEKGSDAKDDYGHVYSDGIAVIEPEVETSTYKSLGNVRTSSWGIEWDSSSPIVSFSNNGNILDGEFDLSAKAGSSSSISSNGLEFCDSMYTGSRVNAFVDMAVRIANDNTIGVTKDKYQRTSRTSMDSASFVYYSLIDSNVLKAQPEVFSLSNMGAILQPNGFELIEYNAENLQKGDILVEKNEVLSKAMVYIGDNKIVIADESKDDNKPGDESGEEISIQTFNPNVQYSAVYRYSYEKQYNISTGGSSSSGPNGPTKENELLEFNDTEFVVVKTYSGGVESYASKLQANGVRQSEDSDWYNCCGGFAQVQACGLYKGKVPTQSSGNLSACNDASFGSCDSNWSTVGNRGVCTEDEHEFLQTVIDGIKDGHPVIIVVNGGKINGSETNRYRHFVTAIGFKNGSKANDYTDLLIIDSFDARIKQLGEDTRRIKGHGYTINNSDCSGNFASVVY